MENKEFEVFQAWLVNGFSQPNIDKVILRIESKDTKGFECSKILNKKYGITREYKNMFGFTQNWIHVHEDNIKQAFLNVEEVLGSKIPEATRDILNTFWGMYLQERNEHQLAA